MAVDGEERERPPAFQFYARDWLASPSVMSMTLTERGAYIHLLSIAWLRGSVPADEAQRARLLGVTKAQLRKLWVALEDCWVSDGNGGLVNPRQERVRAEQAAYRASRSEAGRRAAEARWSSEREGAAR